MSSASVTKLTKRAGVSLFLAAFCWNVGASAAPEAEKLVRDTTDRVIEILKKERAVIDNDPTRLYGIVDQEILPHFDFRRMSQRVLGKYWNGATSDQQAQFISQFQVLLVRTYATALREYSEQQIGFLPARVRDGGEEVTVRTQIQQSGAPPIPINYEMYRKENSWKVYDVSIDGVSLVINYRSTFAAEIRQGGVDGLIQRLAKHNAEKR